MNLSRPMGMGFRAPRALTNFEFVYIVHHEIPLVEALMNEGFTMSEPMSMSERIAKRLRKDRPMTQISLRMPEDVVDDLKLVAEVMGFSGYQPVMKFYIGQALRKDLDKIASVRANELIVSLKKHGLTESQIKEILIESQVKPA